MTLDCHESLAMRGSLGECRCCEDATRPRPRWNRVERFTILGLSSHVYLLTCPDTAYTKYVRLISSPTFCNSTISALDTSLALRRLTTMSPSPSCRSLPCFSLYYGGYSLRHRLVGGSVLYICRIRHPDIVVELVDTVLQCCNRKVGHI
jgi:hypothetical protein